MPVTRLNHAVLYVRNAARSAAFYRLVLGFRVVGEMAAGQALFLQAPASTNDHDLGLFEVGDTADASGAGQSSVGLYHLAWEVDTLDELERIAGKLSAAGAFVGSADHGTTKALYASDPDGLELEISWLVPADQLLPDVTVGVAPLDLVRDKQRYGGSTRGGIGISTPADPAATLAG